MKNSLFSIIITGVLISVPLTPSSVICPESLQEWFIKEGFSYQKEAKGKDYWKNPKETIVDKGGDCEDFVFLVDKVLLDLGYKTQTVAILFKNKKTAHAICIIQINNKYTWFCNNVYGKKQYYTIQNLLNENYPDWNHYYTISLPKRYKNRVNRK